MKYIIHYDTNSDEGRTYALAATNKADYIIKILNKLGKNVEIVSASLTSSKGYIRGSKTNITEKTKLIKLQAFKWGNKIQKVIAYLWTMLGLCIYLVFKTKRNEEVIAYHSLATMRPISIAKKIKKFKLILEVEEIYADVSKRVEKLRNKELKFFECADKYIFPTGMLNDAINKENKPYCIIHGTYNVEPDRRVSFNDDKIHVVYAGTFDPDKGGAVAAVASAELLPVNYHIHIIGFGSDADTEHIKNVIIQTNEKSKATVTYDGLLSGEEYIEFLQKCHIGLSTQNPDAAFNATSFPSKILSYMANGLRVVSIRIPAIEKSQIGQDISYYDEQTPEKIAKAIMDVDLNDDYNSRKKITELDCKFKEELKELIGE